MGVYDRDYYRDQQPRGYWLAENRVTPWLALAYIGVYVLQLVTAGRAWHGYFTDGLMFDVERFARGEIWRIVTGLFIHDTNNWLNVVWNVLILWFFGRQLEEIYGGLKFLALYLVAGVIGNLAWALGYWLGFVSVWQARQIIFGAAPAITFVLVLCALHFPRQTVLLFFVLPVPLWLVAVLYVGKDLIGFLQQLGGLGKPSIGIVHVAAAAWAAGYYYLPGWRWRLPSWGAAYSRRDEILPSIPPMQNRDTSLEAQADAILEKLSRQGKDSLTPQEWEILHRASEAYRRRR
jgi:membrane associated rhomboid family serine protease